MDDARVELSTLTGGGNPAPILRALDSVELVVEASAERTRSREDQVALYNLAAQAFGRILVGAGVNLPFHATSGFTANLLDYGLAEAPEIDAGCRMRLVPLALLGAGSVGSSAVYVALLAGIEGGPVDLVD